MSFVSGLPAHPSLEQLHKRAKELLHQLRAGDLAALDRVRLGKPRLAGPPQKFTLSDAQFVLAREYGFESWAKMKHHIEALPALGTEQYEQLARDLAAAHVSGDANALGEINANYGTAFTSDFHDKTTMQQRLTTWFASDSRTSNLALADARQMVAHAYGGAFPDSSEPFYQIDWNEKRLTAKGPHSEAGWALILAATDEHHITKLEAPGINDAMMKRLAQHDQITHLRVSSKALTDDGLKYLAAMPQLRELEVSGPQLTDKGFEMLRHLRELRRFQSCWTQGISDIGLASLAFCDLIESVDVTGTAAGDGLNRGMVGKAKLRRLKTGRGVTDEGIKLVHEIPAFTVWPNEEMRYGLMSAEMRPNHLQVDGPFTDSGLAELGGLDGLCGLSFFWHSPSFTSKGLRWLRQLPQLGFFGCPGKQCDDEAMR